MTYFEEQLLKLTEEEEMTKDEIVNIKDCQVLVTSFNELYAVYDKVYREMHKTKQVTNAVANDIATKQMRCTSILREILEILQEV